MNFSLHTINFNDKQKIVIFTIILMLISALFYLALFLPQYYQMVNLQNQYQTERQRVRGIENFAVNHPDVDQYLQELDLQFQQVEKQLPESDDISEFLIQAEQISKDSGIQLMHLKPLPVLSKNGYREVPLEIVIKGNFNQTILFLKNLENSPRFNTVTNMSVQSKKGILESKLTVILYSFGVSANPQNAPAK